MIMLKELAKLLAKELEKANKWERNTLLAYKEKTNINKIPMVHQYHPSLIPINKRLQKEWETLSHHPRFGNLFSKPLVCAFKQPATLNGYWLTAPYPALFPYMVTKMQKAQMPSLQHPQHPGDYYPSWHKYRTKARTF